MATMAKTATTTTKNTATVQAAMKLDSRGIRSASTADLLSRGLHHESIRQPVEPIIYRAPYSTAQFFATVSQTKRYQADFLEIQKIASDMHFLYPVTIKIEQDEAVFIASCPTFNIAIQEDSSLEALESIKSLLSDDYHSLLNDYPDGLTEDAKNLLQLYSAFLGRKL